MEAWPLYQHLTKRHALTVTVAHYPPGASKWNPIEHRLFSEVSKNWAGRPLDSYETILNYIRTTSTKTGLRVQAQLVGRHYDKGVKITDTELAAVPLHPHEWHGEWNYTINAQTIPA